MANFFGEQAKRLRLCPMHIMTSGAMACVVAACASSPTSQVQDLGSGIYSITYAAKSDAQAIRKAGEYCHAKGQKLSVAYTGHDYEVRFRCVAPE